MKYYLYRTFGLIIMWLMIVATAMQSDTIIWLLLAVTSFIIFYFVCKLSKVTVTFKQMKQYPRSINKYLIYGVLIGSAYSIIRFLILINIGAIDILKIFPASIDTIIIAVIFLIVSNSYIALAEEIVFRGYVINVLPKSFNQNLTLVLSSCLFLFAHSINGIFSVSRIIELLFLGLVIGILYIKTRSLWLAIGLHFGLNFFGFFLGGDGDVSRQYIFLTTKTSLYSSLVKITDSILPVMLFLLTFIILNFVLRKDVS